MTIGFPVDLPAGKLLECSFDLLDPVSSVSSASGKKLNQTRTIDPMWQATIATSGLDRAQRAAWRAWRKSLRGGLNHFLAFDFARRAPLAHWAATSADDISGSWNGTASVTALGASGVLSLSDLPSGYTITADDPIGLVEDGQYGYFSALETVTEDAGAADIQVAPFEHFPVFSVAASVVLWRPMAKFSIDWSSWKMPEVDGLSSASFTARQVL